MPRRRVRAGLAPRSRARELTKVGRGEARISVRPVSHLARGRQPEIGEMSLRPHRLAGPPAIAALLWRSTIPAADNLSRTWQARRTPAPEVQAPRLPRHAR